MKKTLLWIAFFIATFFLSACPMDIENLPTTAEAAIIWVNPEFRGVARTALENPDGDILPSQVATITTLDLSNKSISAIGDIKYFTGLTSLNLSNNQIDDIAALAGLNKLSIVDLSKNQISNISVLASVTPKLDTLKLEKNQIDDIRALSNLKASAIVNLSENLISDLPSSWTYIEHVVDVTGRPSIIIWQDPVIEAAARDTLSKPGGDILTTEVARGIHTLDLSTQTISELSDIRYFTGLTSLNLYGTNSTTLSALSTLPNLLTLNLGNNAGITNWIPVAHIPTVTGRPPHIIWEDTSFEAAIRTILGRPSGVILPTEIDTITTLDLSTKNISTIGDIIHFTAATSIDLNDNNISDLSPLSTFNNFAQLITLDVSTNQISDISPLNTVTNSVGIVDLQNNDIYNWSYASGITNVLGRPSYVWTTSEPALVNNVYQISQPEHLAWVAAQGENNNFSGKTIQFMNDIDMQNNLFSGIKTFSGIMDGNGKKIKNLRISRPNDTYVGLVRYLASGEIKNLTIESGSIQGGNHVGAFVGVARISNVGNDADAIPVLSGLINKASVNGVGIVGGIIGASPSMPKYPPRPDTPNITPPYDGRPSMTMTNVQNTGRITGSQSIVGGIIGKASYMVLENATNNGAIRGMGRTGGIVGWTTNIVTITHATNNGGVSIIQDFAAVGGIVGEVFYGNGTTITNVTNTGTIAARGNAFRIGGIIGWADGTEGSGPNGLVIQNAINSGSIDAEGNFVTIEGSNIGIMVGGIIGVALGDVRLIQAENSATIKSKGEFSTAGGIVGFANSATMQINKVLNSGNVVADLSDSFAAGIIGQAIDTITIRDAGNTGTIDTSISNGIAGGIIGYNDRANSYDVYNYGSINGEYAGSLLGVMTKTVVAKGYYLVTTPLSPIGGITSNVDTSSIVTTIAPLSANQFKNASSFVGWDFINTWVMGANYPVLQ